ncbi:hypothetical protein DPMN_170403 [Dreissena polymorpha]|uniref:Uncharacterized protein n=1 Tax=Dreissena polymorpha TaxID=45954 RepID=A0A9D4DZ72_DREPO|nr:hypothetical protein DPMN_170403 [Dreissena polymorpha]
MLVPVKSLCGGCLHIIKSSLPSHNLVSSWSVDVANESRVARRRFSHLYIFPYRGELLRAALLIQLSPSPSSRTSSTLLGLLSSPTFSGLVIGCLSSRVCWPGPARGPVCRGTVTVGQRDHQCGGQMGQTWGLPFAGGCMSHEHRGGGLIEGPRGGVTQYAQRTGETISGMKTTAGDDESGHKGRAVRCSPLVELRSDINLS